MMKLPASERAKAALANCRAVVLMAAEDSRTDVHAVVGMLKALNHGKPEPEAAAGRKRAKVYRVVK